MKLHNYPQVRFWTSFPYWVKVGIGLVITFLIGLGLGVTYG